MLHDLPSPVSGKIGVWSKADSVVYYDDSGREECPVIAEGGGDNVAGFGKGRNDDSSKCLEDK